MKRSTALVLVTLVLTAVLVVSTGCGQGRYGKPIGIIDWIDFIKFADITYQRNVSSLESYREEDFSAYDSVRFKVADNIHDPGYRIKNGDAAFLEQGTSVYSIKGYSPSFRLAARTDEGMLLYEVDSNPAARKGADLLDIGGKVEYIGVNSPVDKTTELASIKEPGLVSSLVDMVINAPVDQTVQRYEGEQMFIAFHLTDNTTVVHSFWTGSGELSNGIMLPDEFGKTVKSFVP